jgi:hypothetical protein
LISKHPHANKNCEARAANNQLTHDSVKEKGKNFYSQNKPERLSDSQKQFYRL